MDKQYNYLLKFLKDKELLIDESEFILQLQSHPDYPSLLAVSDTLLFFNIDNAAFRITNKQLPDLPNDFICQIKISDGNNDLVYVRQNNNGFEIYNNDTFETKSLKKFQTIFDGIVLLAEKSAHFTPSTKSDKNTFINTLAVFLFVITSSFLGFSHYRYLVFFLTSCLGLFFSVQALKEVFGVESKVLAKVCNSSTNVSCDSVLKSDKWALFKKISFSDLSLLFFAVQVVAMLVFTALHQTESFLNLQKILLIISIIPIATSLYYQKMVEKKWCPVCLLIITTLLAQMVFIELTQVTLVATVDIYTLVIFTLVAISLLTVWLPLKKVLVAQKQLQEDNFKLKRFSRNYEIFKNTLVKYNKIHFPVDNSIVLGNKKSDFIISIVTSPFCGHCKVVHEVIDNILSKHDNVKFDIYFNTSIKIISEAEQEIFRGLIDIYLTKGADAFAKSIKKIHQSDTILPPSNIILSDINLIDIILDNQKNFCKSQNIHYTPAIYISGYLFPKMYERSELEFFITELIEDETL